MLYEVDIEIATANTITNKLKTVIGITNGVIHQLSVSFPPGCANLAKVTINKGKNQIFPTNPDGQIKGDNINVQGKTFHPVLDAPYEVDVYAWNDGAAFPHVVTVRLWVLKVWQLMPFSDEMYMLALRQGVGTI